MARGGINKAIVQKARQALLARGEHPSIDAVRIELATQGPRPRFTATSRSWTRSNRHWRRTSRA